MSMNVFKHLPDEKQNPLAAPNVENNTAMGMMT